MVKSGFRCRFSDTYANAQHNPLLCPKPVYFKMKVEISCVAFHSLITLLCSPSDITIAWVPNCFMRLMFVFLYNQQKISLCSSSVFCYSLTICWVIGLHVVTNFITRVEIFHSSFYHLSIMSSLLCQWSDNMILIWIWYILVSYKIWNILTSISTLYFHVFFKLWGCRTPSVLTLLSQISSSLVERI